MSYLSFNFGCLCIVKDRDGLKIVNKLKELSISDNIKCILTIL